MPDAALKKLDLPSNLPSNLGSDVVLSFGTDGGRGNTCIVTQNIDKIPFISVVTAIKKDDAEA